LDPVIRTGAKTGMTMMGAKAFVDTNVLLQATIAQAPHHQSAQRLIATQITTELWVSRQVIREYMVQTTRPQVYMPPMTFTQLEDQLVKMRAVFQIADETELVAQQLIDLMRVYPSGGKQVHDANIVATMLVYGIDTLLTINIADMKRFADKIILIAPGEKTS